MNQHFYLLGISRALCPVKRRPPAWPQDTWKADLEGLMKKVPILPSLPRTLQYLDGCCCPVTKLCQLFSHFMDCSPTRLLCPWDFPGKNPGVGCHSLPQGIFLTQGSNLCLLHWYASSLPLGTPWEACTWIEGVF